MTLSVKEQAAIARLRTKIKKQTQYSIAESLGISPTALSAWKAVMQAIGVDIPCFAPNQSLGGKARVVAIAKALGRTKSNGVHAR